MVYCYTSNLMSDFKINNNILSTDINSESILFDTDRGLYFKLNSSSKYIYDQINKGYSKVKIIKNISKEFQISEENAQISVNNFIKAAKEKKIF